MSGKGDKPRNVGPKFKENYDSINWHRNTNGSETKSKNGVQKSRVQSGQGSVSSVRRKRTQPVDVSGS